jgi:TolB protein
MFLCGAVATPIAGLALWQARRQQTSAAEPIPPAATAEVESSQSLDLAPDGEPVVEVVNRIAFVDLDAQVNTIAPDGGLLRQLTDSEDFFQFPAWSPDSTRVAAVATGPDGGRLVVMNDEGEPGAPPDELYRSFDERPFYLYWSPDGQQISFLANHPEGIGLHLADVAGSNATRLFTVGQPVYWDWADPGRMLLHTGFVGDNARLAYLDSNGDDSGENIARPGYFQAPGVSASGRYWSFAAVDEGGDRSIVVQDSQGATHTEQPHEGLAAMSWSPADDLLAYVSPEVRTTVFFGPLRLLIAQNGSVEVLSSRLVLAFFWSPDGQSIAYFTVGQAENPGTNASLGPSRVAARQAQQSIIPALQDEGIELDLWVADVASGDSRHLLTFRPTRIFLTQFLPFFDQYALSHRLWSPDSAALTLPVVSSNAPEIVVVSALTGEATAIAGGIMAFWSQR